MDLTGQRFGRLTAIEHLYKQNTWRVRCDCGREKHVAGRALRSGCTRSCGCLNSELAASRKRTHGRAGTPEYRSWLAAKQRCDDPTDADYGGRGIKMCDEWAGNFQAFFEHIGPRPSIRHTLDRVRVNGNYEPGNVRWATPFQQANNCRSNRLVTWRGKTRTIAEWAAETGLSYATVSQRITKYNWTPEEALTVPVRSIRHRR